MIHFQVIKKIPWCSAVRHHTLVDTQVGGDVVGGAAHGVHLASLPLSFSLALALLPLFLSLAGTHHARLMEWVNRFKTVIKHGLHV